MLDPALAPFTIALLVMVLIALLEGAGLLFGAPPSALIENALPDLEVHSPSGLDADVPQTADGAAGPGPLSQLLSWLCVGRVPLLVLLVAFLTAFGVAGLVLQGMVKAVLGGYLPALVMMVPAFFAALPTTRALGLALSKVMPKEETQAISQDTFIGRIATVIRGEARRGLPAEAKLKDLHGYTHYVLVEPDVDGDVFGQGTEVLVVQKVGATFRVILNTHPELRSES